MLLKNDQNLIPLQRLDTLKIAYLNMGLEAENGFGKTLKKYMPIDEISLPERDAMGRNDWIEDLKRQYNLFILGVEGEKEKAYEDVQLDLKKIVKHPNTVTVIFSPGKNLASNSFWKLNATSLMVSPANNYAHTLAAQAVFGGTGISGKSTTAYGNFPQGSGLSTSGINRLRYSPAAEAGMDAQLLNDSIAAISKGRDRSRCLPRCPGVGSKRWPCGLS